MRSIDMLAQEMKDRLADKNQAIDRLIIFKEAIYNMASKRQASVNDYIRIAKQAIADYERAGGHYQDTSKKCNSENPNIMCDGCNCWKFTREMCS